MSLVASPCIRVKASGVGGWGTLGETGAPSVVCNDILARDLPWPVEWGIYWPHRGQLIGLLLVLLLLLLSHGSGGGGEDAWELKRANY